MPNLEDLIQIKMPPSSSSSLLFLLLFLLLLTRTPLIPAQAAKLKVYRVRDAGACGDDDDAWTAVMGPSDCEQGGKAVGWRFEQARRTPLDEEYDRPYGCYAHDLGRDLVFNANFEQLQNGGTACSKGNLCVCTVSAYACRRTNGIEKNAAKTCVCGETACTETTGFYCIEGKNRCTKFAPCSQPTGSVANEASCACGTVDCVNNETTGMLCYAQENRCRKHKPCAVEDGSAGASGSSARGSSSRCPSRLRRRS